MTSQALYRKWRPQTWDEVVSQEHIVRILKNAIRSDRVGHAYLFSGPRGTGKTTIARILARAVICLDSDLGARPCDHCSNCIAMNEGRFLDIMEIDAASNTSVDDVRDLRDKINFSPTQGRMKVYIIDEVHMLSTAAFNALLKTLEEPPSHAMFILATTEIHKIPSTVLSRCQHHEFRRIPVTDIVQWLQKICAEEKIDAHPDALTLIARQATGAMRDAISMLDQLSSNGEKITLQTAQNTLGVAANQAVIDLIGSITEYNTAEGLSALHKALDSGSDSRQLARQVVDYLRQLLILRLGTNESLEISSENRALMQQQCQKISTDRLVNMIRLFNQAAVDSRVGWHPGLNLELALAESCVEEKPVQVVEKLIEKIAAKKPEEFIAVDDDLEETEDQPLKVIIKKGQIPDPTVTKEEIERNWSKVRALIKQHDAILDATLNHAKLLYVRDGVLYLGFPREMIKNKVEENRKSLLWTSAAISNILGKPVGVSLTILRKRSAVADSSAGPLVDAALQMGGKLVVQK
jgi:DNA polymerase-3 subunit gamma/tau